MKNIVILVPEEAVMQAIADPQYLFNTANQMLLSTGREALFSITLAGAHTEVPVGNGSYRVRTDALIDEVDEADLVIIPALFGDMDRAVRKNERLIDWLRARYHGGSEIASLCVGTFLLAQTGLLDGKKCSTHWGFYNEFRERYPAVEVVDGSIITEEERLYSSGGAHSYWNLLLYILEKYTDRNIAILASKYFAIDIDRDNQSAFAMFKGQKNHKDADVLKAQDYIEENSHEKLTIDELADHINLGRRSFERRFKQATGNSVLEYIHRVKIESAKRSFESSRKNINEVMFDVGYTDTKAFRTVFKKVTGLTPMEYRNKYNRN